MSEAGDSSEDGNMLIANANYAVLLIFSFTAILTQPDDGQAKRLQSQIVFANAEAVASKSTQPWAGKYIAGSHTGYTSVLEFAPTVGYLIETHAVRTTYETGAIVETTNKGMSITRSPRDVEGTSSLVADHFYFVKWGDRRYVVPRDRMTAFCNAYNNGRLKDADVDLFWVNAEDVCKAGAGTPRVDEAYEHMLLTAPIAATVVKVWSLEEDQVNSKLVLTTGDAVIDAGAAQGVRQGMEFVGKDNARMIVEKCEGSWSTCRFISSLGMLPRVGEKVVAGTRWDR